VNKGCASCGKKENRFGGADPGWVWEGVKGVIVLSKTQGSQEEQGGPGLWGGVAVVFLWGGTLRGWLQVTLFFRGVNKKNDHLKGRSLRLR